jgi:SsrA-binding protein
MAPPGVKVIATNRRARHDYHLFDTVEAGLVLRGSEVKSLREAKVQISDAYARIDDGEAWLVGLHIAPWRTAAHFGAHEPDRKRKLLLNRTEIERLRARIDQDRLTLVPLSMYFKEGRAKIELALAKSKPKGDRRQEIAKRDADREAARAMSRARKGQD